MVYIFEQTTSSFQKISSGFVPLWSLKIDTHSRKKGPFQGIIYDVQINIVIVDLLYQNSQIQFIVSAKGKLLNIKDLNDRSEYSLHIPKHKIDQYKQYLENTDYVLLNKIAYDKQSGALMHKIIKKTRYIREYVPEHTNYHRMLVNDDQNVLRLLSFDKNDGKIGDIFMLTSYSQKHRSMIVKTNNGVYIPLSSV